MIADLLDDAGYLTDRCADIAKRLGVALAAAEQALADRPELRPDRGRRARPRRMPRAPGARADRYDPAMARLIDNLDLLARGDMIALRRICEVDQEDLADMVRELRGYDPKPGLPIRRDAAEDVAPDVFVRRLGQGWAVELNSATLPRLLVNRSYYVELARAAGQGEPRLAVECLASANWLVKALDQRARTIVKVATEIVKQQEGFFAHGVAA